ncbi:hypothetical protein [Sandaracinus amylolyticus]|uniref:Uncharacterized protein n=1 Tax=Sandaracinus amylolyticus TaxID=927083 RepID=A0A0F6YMI4_9BACT|nr:hypothetical protein [Sandaracinus amylolyticus]AKF11070.1 hypothetical protein DB32_008219 [Sandaracinus amylolyticus]
MSTDRLRRENDAELERFLAFVRQRTAAASTTHATLEDLASLVVGVSFVLLVLYLRHFAR